MNLVEHWTVTVCDQCGQAGEHGTACPWPRATVTSVDGKAVEVVRADAYRGAVQDVERLRGVLAVVVAAKPEDAAGFAQAALDAPSTANRGQYDASPAPPRKLVDRDG